MTSPPPLKIVGLFPDGFDKHFVRPAVRAVLAEGGEYQVLDWHCDRPPPEADMVRALAAADVALTGWLTPPLPESLLAQPDRKLKYICNLTGSIKRWIPRCYLEQSIRVTNWGDGPMWYLAEGNLMLMLALTREVQRVHRHMVERPQWAYSYTSPTPTLREKTIGFVGFGAVARSLLGLLTPFSAKALIYDPFIPSLPPNTTRCETLEELFSQADIITVQCGLNAKTEGLIGKDLLARLKPHALLINTARGKIIREKELIEFLKIRPDVSAGLDVFEMEPLPLDSPLLKMENVICYPHSVGGGQENLQAAAAIQAARNLRAYFQGEPLDAEITPAKYDLIT